MERGGEESNHIPEDYYVHISWVKILHKNKKAPNTKEAIDGLDHIEEQKNRAGVPVEVSISSSSCLGMLSALQVKRNP